MKKFNLSILAMLIFVFCHADSSAQTRVSFARGKSSTTVSGALGGRGASNSVKKFLIRGWHGQHLSVVVKATNRSVYTNMSDSEGERGADFYYSLDSDGDHEFIVENVGARATKFTIIVSIE